MTLWFDMDGTIVDFYSVPNWLEMLINEDATPYSIAKPLVNLSYLARLLNQAQKCGAKIGIISWSSKAASADFDSAVEKAKKEWLARHLPSVTWDEIHITPYGRNKWETCGDINSILFDDEERNRNAWQNKAGYEPSYMFDVLKDVIRMAA